MVFDDIMVTSIFSLPIAQDATRMRAGVQELDFKFLWRRSVPPSLYENYAGLANEVPTEIYIPTEEPSILIEKDTIMIDANTYMVIGVLDLKHGLTRVDLQWHSV